MKEKKENTKLKEKIIHRAIEFKEKEKLVLWTKLIWNGEFWVKKEFMESKLKKIKFNIIYRIKKDCSTYLPMDEDTLCKDCRETIDIVEQEFENIGDKNAKD
jgi:hypothetical protein